MTLMALVLTVVKAAAVFALLGVTVRTLKRIDHRRAISGGAPSRRARRRGPRLGSGPRRSHPARTHRRMFAEAGASPLAGFDGPSDSAGRAGRAGVSSPTDVGGRATSTASATSKASALARVRRPRSARRVPRALEIVERATLGRTSAVVLVRVRDHHVLLGVTDQQITVLRTLEPEPAIDLRHDRTGANGGDTVSADRRADTEGDVDGRTGSNAWSSDPAENEHDIRGWGLPRPQRGGRDRIEVLDPHHLWRPEPNRSPEGTDTAVDRS